MSRRVLLAGGLGLVLAGCTGKAATRDPAGATVDSIPQSTAATTVRTVGPRSIPPTTAAGISSPEDDLTTSQPVPTTRPAAGPAAEVGTGPPGKPMVALTFHGGDDPATARAILAVCAERSARVTVLAIGTWLASNPSMAAEILGGGHDLGNHTWSHQVLADLGEAEVRDEIVRCRDLLVAQTGSPGAFFRTSSGQHASPLILREAGLAGYPICLSYDVDPEDWTDPGAEAVRSGVAQATAGSIVSLHFGHPGTVDALPGILDDLAARGLQPVTAGTLLR